MRLHFFGSPVDAISANHQATACSLPDATLGHVQSNYAIHQTRNTAAQPQIDSILKVLRKVKRLLFPQFSVSKILKA